MKKLSFCFLFIGAVTGAQAQTSAGHYLVSGLVNYSSSKTDDNSYSNSARNRDQYFQFIPTIGYFVANNIALGISGNVISNKQTQVFSDNSYKYTHSYSMKSVGPFVRYYKMITEEFGFYGQLEGAYLSGTDKNESVRGTEISNTTSRRRGGSGTVTPGLVYFPIEKLGIQLGLGSVSYFRTKNTPQSPATGDNRSSKSSGFNTTFGLAYLSVGASIHLGSN